MELQIGDLCVIPYKSGTYVGKYMERSANSPRAVVMILAVLEHPMQGDLHHPYETEVPLFHERKASAYQEQVLVPIGTMRAYEGEMPDYSASLRSSFEKYFSEMNRRGDEYGQRSAEQLEKLKQEYGWE